MQSQAYARIAEEKEDR